MRIAIVYHSGMGHTQKMAEAVAHGARLVTGAQVSLHPILGEHIVNGRWKNPELLKELDAVDAIIFGSPTYMGSYSGQFKCFADATGEKYYNRAWVDKIAGGFTVSGGPSGDKLNTLVSFAVLAMQLGMIWVGTGNTPMNDQGVNRLSSYFGPMGQAPAQESPDAVPNAADKLTGELYGKRVAEITQRLRGK